MRAQPPQGQGWCRIWTQRAKRGESEKPCPGRVGEPAQVSMMFDQDESGAACDTSPLRGEVALLARSQRNTL